MQELILTHKTAIVIEPGTALQASADVPLRIRCEDYDGSEALPTIVLFSTEPAEDDRMQIIATWEVLGADAVTVDWGDGSNTGAIIADQDATHVYIRNGVYHVTLTATNMTGMVSETRIVEISQVVSAKGNTFTRCLSMTATVDSNRQGGMV